VAAAADSALVDPPVPQRGLAGASRQTCQAITWLVRGVIAELGAVAHAHGKGHSRPAGLH
jgi:hypothetical protein